MKFDEYEKPAVTVDTIIFTIREESLQVLLVKRNVEPFKGGWAIPGGFVKINESLDNAAKRELLEETGVENIYLEQLYSFGKVNRDPRGRVITISYIALVNSDKIDLKASTDVLEAKWFKVNDLPKLSFDHKEILSYALQRLKWKFEYTSIGFSLLDKKFKVSELLKLYEIVFGREFDKRNFSKKLHSLKILKEVGLEKDVSHRPSKLYSLKAKLPEIIELI